LLHSQGSVYPDDGGIPARVPLSEDVIAAARSQHQDNEGARLVHLLAVAQQMAGQPDLRAMLLPLLVESAINTTDALTDAVAMSEQRIMAFHDAQPVSIFSCLVCGSPLPTISRGRLLQRIRALNYVVAPGKVGQHVPLEMLYVLFCGPCAVEDQQDQDDQRRAEQAALQARQQKLQRMSYADYLLTPEWRAVRYRKLTMAGHRCEFCNNPRSLNVHHRVYDRRGRELLKDLRVLCRSCHQRHHGILPRVA
jgi:5-methylcytosine-specific restriction endonuclease McrA